VTGTRNAAIYFAATSWTIDRMVVGMVVGMVVAMVLATAATSHANFGGCGQPSSFGAKPTASDALVVLRAAVGTATCKTCVCDTTGEGLVTSSDALRVLRFAIGLGVVLDCPACKSQKVIGAAGGSISALDESITIDIPAGALESDTTISIEEAAVSQLPESLRAEATAWAIEPAGLAFATPATVTVDRSDAFVAGPGAKVAMLVSVDDAGTEVLANQTQSIDETVAPTSVTAHADLGRASVVAVVSLDVTARLVGLPATVIQVDEPLILTALVSQSSGEDAVSVQSASYTDDNVGSFHPDGIPSSDVPLEQVTENNFGHGFDYICSSQVLAFFTPRIEIVYDVTADFEGAPSEVEHTTFIKTDVECAP
jgi:hypothetical protein